jgi:hypothetical protein
MSGHISFKSVTFILKLLNRQLKEKRKILKEQQNISDIPVEIYKKTLASCKEIEYTIKEMEKFL